MEMEPNIDRPQECLCKEEVHYIFVRNKEGHEVTGTNEPLVLKGNEQRHTRVKTKSTSRLTFDIITVWCIRNLPVILLLILYSNTCLHVEAAVFNKAGQDLILISNCSLPLSKCHTTDRDAEFREKCINGFRVDNCPEGTTYLCGIDSKGDFIVEKCVHSKECWRGTSLAYIVDPETFQATLTCLPCKDGYFEPEYTLSSETSHINGCTYQHKSAENISAHLVMHRQGTKSSATEWHCDADNGYFERDGHMTCDDVPTQPCHCEGKTCIIGHLLRPDGLCVRCHTRLDPDDDWRCKDHERSTSTSNTQSVLSTTKSSSITKARISAETFRTSNLKDDAHTAQKQMSSTKAYSDIIPRTPYAGETSKDDHKVAISIVGVLVTIAICLFLVIMIRRRRHRKTNRPVNRKQRRFNAEPTPENDNTPDVKVLKFTRLRENETEDGSASKSDKVHQTLNITATGNVIVGSHNIMFGCNDKRTESSEDSDIERTSDGEESVGSAQGSMRMHNLKEPLLKMNATERMDESLQSDAVDVDQTHPKEVMNKIEA